MCIIYVYSVYVVRTRTYIYSFENVFRRFKTAREVNSFPSANAAAIIV